MNQVIDKLQRAARMGWNAAKWRLTFRTLPRPADGRLLLHVGCGTIDAPGYVNIDARALPHVHFRLHQLRDLRFIPAGTADMVYLCHVLEHVPVRDVPHLLAVLRGRLRPGGVLRLSVPDFDRVIDIYAQNDRKVESILGPLMGGQDYAHNFHYVAFNRSYLTQLLLQGGFRDVYEWSPQTASDHGFDDWSGRPVEFEGRRYPISLNLQAVRA